MDEFNADGPSDPDWDEQGELTWNEFDWERYLREQDVAINRYVSHYEKLKGHPDRIDETARLMGWDDGEWSSDDAAPEVEVSDAGQVEEEAPVDYEDMEPYTLYKNPVFIATKAIYLGLRRAWDPIARDPNWVPQKVAVTFQSSLYRGEEQAGLAIQALDLGDFAMAVSLFKRAMSELNVSLGLTDGQHMTHSRALLAFRDDARPRLFDLREIWLRVMNECRDELARHIEGES